MEDLVGKTLGPYEIISEIGRGGMANVFKAYQPTLDRFVAIKVLSPHLANEADFTERFQREARAIARLNHPNILQVYDSGLQNGYNYLVMRYVDGSVSLGTLMKQGVSTDRLINYIVQVASALNYAHERGIIHRDVKPNNILIDGEWALLSDFGLVKDIGNPKHLTATSRGGIGTPAYMSPEQTRGAEIDHRTDIYALGAILYEILTGHIPHDAPTPLAIATKRITEPVPPPRELNPNIPENLEQVALRALMIEPDYRFDIAADFAKSLQLAYKNRLNIDAEAPPFATVPEPLLALNPTEPAHAAQTRAPEFVPAGPQKKVGLLVSGGVAVVAIIVLLILVLSSGENSNGQAATSPFYTPSLNEFVLALDSTALPTATGVPPTLTPDLGLSGNPIVTTKTEVDVWSGPGDNYELLGYLPTGVKVEISSRDQSSAWWQIKTSLGSTGSGWIQADANLTEVANVEAVPIGLAPPTPLPSATPTAEPTSPSPEPVSTNTATFTATPTLSEPATPTLPAVSPTKSLPPTPIPNEFVLLEPASLEEPSYGMTEFEWQWPGALAENQGFEVRVWRDSEPPAGVHDALLDNKEGAVQALANNTYRLIADISEAPGVRQRRGEYNWTVVLVQLEPEYKDLGVQAPAGRLRFEPPGGGNGGGDEGGGTLIGGD